MTPLVSLVLAAFALSPVVKAHFNLDLPPSYGFEEAKERHAPCGGFDVYFNNISNMSDFHVDGDAIKTRLAHFGADWLYRATIEPATENNWTQLYPIFRQEGVGNFCQPSVSAPYDWIGRQGIISVVTEASDGILYQCAAVNFVSGAVDGYHECRNASTTAKFVDSPDLASLVGHPTSTLSPSSSTSAPPSASTTISPTYSVASRANICRIALWLFLFLITLI